VESGLGRERVPDRGRDLVGRDGQHPAVDQHHVARRTQRDPHLVVEIRLRPVTLPASVPSGSVAPSQPNESGTRWAAPYRPPALATQQSTSVSSRARVSLIRWLALRAGSTMPRP